MGYPCRKADGRPRYFFTKHRNYRYYHALCLPCDRRFARRIQRPRKILRVKLNAEASGDSSFADDAMIHGPKRCPTARCNR